MVGILVKRSACKRQRINRVLAPRYLKEQCAFFAGHNESRRQKFSHLA